MSRRKPTNVARVILCVAAVGALLTLRANPAEARVRASSVLYFGDCSQLLASTPFGWTVAEYWRGSVPSTGDVMVGEMDRFGFKDWQIRGRSRSTRVYVNDYSLDNDAAIEYLIEKDCDLSVLDS